MGTEFETAVTVVPVRCLKDNYAYLIHDADSQRTVLVDAPEAAPIQAELAKRGWKLSIIFLTHHHDDHVAGVAALREGTQVIGARADAYRLPPLDILVEPGDMIDIAFHVFEVMDAPGHTLGQIAFHAPSFASLFTGDSLMIHGCGRLFEGSAADMQSCFDRFATLPEETRIWSGHDYAAANLAFAARFAIDPADLAAREAALVRLAETGEAVTGITLAEEKRLNPYFRVHLPQVKAAAGLPEGTEAEVFAAIRRLKDAA